MKYFDDDEILEIEETLVDLQRKLGDTLDERDSIDMDIDDLLDEINQLQQKLFDLKN